MDIDWSQGMPLMAGPWQIGLAEPSPETTGYWEGIARGVLVIKKCANCGGYQHPRRLFCTTCENDVFDWVETSGKATVYTFSTVHRAPTPEYENEVPYTVGILHLAENVFLFSRILPSGDRDIRIGDPVTLTFRETGQKGRLPAYQVDG